MTLNHETIVHHAVFRKAQVSDRVSEHYTGYDSGAGGTETAAEGNGVVDVEAGFEGEGTLVVTLEDVESGAGDEVAGGIERDVGSAFAFVGDSAIEGVGGGGDGAVDGDGEFKPNGEGDSEDVKTRA